MKKGDVYVCSNVSVAEHQSTDTRSGDTYMHASENVGSLHLYCSVKNQSINFSFIEKKENPFDTDANGFTKKVEY